MTSQERATFTGTLPAINEPSLRDKQDQQTYQLTKTLEEGLRWWKREKRIGLITSIAGLTIMGLMFGIPLIYLIKTGTFLEAFGGQETLLTSYNCTSEEGYARYRYIVDVKLFKEAYPEGKCYIMHKIQNKTGD